MLFIQGRTGRLVPADAPQNDPFLRILLDYSGLVALLSAFAALSVVASLLALLRGPHQRVAGPDAGPRRGQTGSRLATAGETEKPPVQPGDRFRRLPTHIALSGFGEEARSTSEPKLACNPTASSHGAFDVRALTVPRPMVRDGR